MSDLRFVMDIDTRQADAALADVRAEAMSLAGAQDKLTRSIDLTSRSLAGQAADAKRSTAAILAGKDAADQKVGALARLREASAKSADVLGKQAAAISLVSSSLGEAGGGIGKVVAGAGQMAAAFGAGGPFAAALVGGIALVGVLSSHLEDLTAAQNAAIDAATAPAERVIAQANRLERQVADLAAATAGPETVAQAFARVQKEIDGANTSLEDARRRLNDMRTEVGTAGYEQRRANVVAEIKQYERIVRLLERKQNLEQGRAATRGAGAPTAPAGRGPEWDAAQNRIDVEEKAINWLAKMRDEANAHRLANEKRAAEEEAQIVQDRLDAEANAIEWLAKMRDEALKERQRGLEIERQLAMESAQEMAGYATQAVGIASMASQQLVADLVGGQEQALERFGLAIMAQAGQALVSYGTQALGAAALNASLGNLPAAGVQAATGGALLTAGVGLGGVASGLSGLMGGSGGATESGAPARFSGGPAASGGPGMTNITVVYGGASGPDADSGARATIDARDRADRRNLGRTVDR